jgi:arsenite methyltransferase
VPPWSSASPRSHARPTRRESFRSARLGYYPPEIDSLPPSVTESFCGVGNPLGLGELLAGQTVLDLGSGAGLDSLLVARRVGLTGKVVGVDLCPEMVEKARRNAELLGLHNVEFVGAGIEKLPLPDGSVDVVISNGSSTCAPTSPPCWPRRSVSYVRAVASRWPTSCCMRT